MKTFEQCCREVAKEKWPDSLEWQDLLAKSLSCAEASQAATLYANDKLKGLLEEVREMASNYSKELNLPIALACDRIATRIEELINETK